MPIAMTEDHRAVADAVRAWAARAQPVRTVRAQESIPEAWRTHWVELADLGTFAAAVAESYGGGGGRVADQAAVLEATAAVLAPGPALSTAAVATLLSRAGSPVAAELLGPLVAGTRSGAVACAAPDVVASADEGGALRLDGTVGPLVCATGDAVVLLPVLRGDGTQAWVVFHTQDAGVMVQPVAATDLSRPLAVLRLEGVTVPASAVLALDGDVVVDLVATLAASEAAGVAAWCLDTAVEYARVREQFGAPIGSFQAVKHLCAEMLCRAEQAAAVAWDAATAFDDDADQRAVAAAVSAAVALDAAVDNAKDCIQVLGGIGFTWEHDAHLYLRRAVALRQLAGGTAPWRRRIAELTLAGTRRTWRVDAGGSDTDRAEVRSRVAEIAALPPEERRCALADAGYLAPHWPRPYGLDADARLQLLIDEELAAHGVARPDLVIGAWAVPTILNAGTAEQQKRFVPPTLRGELVWCQLFSEPGAGSDLAALRTKAVRVHGGWSISGQKVWTSVANEADWAICLARTDPKAPKHKGITYFLVDMRTPGIDIRPLREITGEALFNEVFLDDVFVPDDNVVGAVGDGWRLARGTLANERVAMAGGAGIDGELESLLHLCADRGRASDPLVLDRLGALVGSSQSGALLDVRATLGRLQGRGTAAASSVRKLIGVRHRQAVAEAALEVIGADAAAAGEQVQHFLMTRCLTIAGGTTQVLLTLAAERILGLPRS